MNLLELENNQNTASNRLRIAFYGGSFDPIHNGHLTIARELCEVFLLDEFVFIPAFHAPHKKNKKVSSGYHRYAMLAAATANFDNTKVSTIELNAPERPYSIETLSKLKSELGETHEIFFVIGADSWQEITTWREWENLLKLVNFIVVTRPNYEITFSHVTPEIQSRIVDLRNNAEQVSAENESRMYITDCVQIDISATKIRSSVAEKSNDWQQYVPNEVAKYIEKYELYK
jgi:nicotinate-nucleotide adenylyltransferase